MPTSRTAQEIISLLSLTPHPEGGYYSETYRDSSTITCSSKDPKSDRANRSASSAIYFLLEDPGFSRLHCIDTAEVWHFYAGTSALEVVELTDAGPRITRLGMDLGKGERPQYVVEKGVWFGARVAGSGTEAKEKGWALVGCTVAPAFLFEKFEMGERRMLEERFPNCAEVVRALTPQD